MDSLFYSQNSTMLVEQIKMYWMYILSILILITYCCYSKTKKFAKNIMKGG